ncbi:hypothetical protein JCM21900_005144 [Sporobolomyces salmonicolor]
MPSSQFSSRPLPVECEVEEREPRPESGRAAQAQNDDDHHGPDYSPAPPSRKPAPRVRQKTSRHQTRDPVTGAFVRSSSSVGGIMSQASQHSHAGSSRSSEVQSQPFVVPARPSSSSRCLYRQKRKRTREQRGHEGDERWRAWREEVLGLPSEEGEGGSGESKGIEDMEGKGALRSWGWWKDADVQDRQGTEADEPMEPVAEAGATKAPVWDPVRMPTGEEDDERLLMPPPASPSAFRSRSPDNDRQRTKQPTEDEDEAQCVEVMGDDRELSNGGERRGMSKRGTIGKGRRSTKGTKRGSRRNDDRPDPPNIRPRSQGSTAIDHSTAAIELPVKLDSIGDPVHAESTFSTTAAAFLARPILSRYSAQAVAPSTGSLIPGFQKLGGTPSPIPHAKGCELYSDVFSASTSSYSLTPTPASSAFTQSLQLLPTGTHRFSPSPALSPSDTFSPCTTTTATATTTFSPSSPETTSTDSPITTTCSPLLPISASGQSKDSSQRQDEEDVLQALVELGTSSPRPMPAIGLGLMFEPEAVHHDVQRPFEGAVREEATLEEVKEPDEEVSGTLALEKRERGLRVEPQKTAERIEAEKTDEETKKEAALDEELEQNKTVQDLSSPCPLSTILVSNAVTETMPSRTSRDDVFGSIPVRDPRSSRWVNTQRTEEPPSPLFPVDTTSQHYIPFPVAPYQSLPLDQPSSVDPSLPRSVSPASTPSPLSFKPRRSSNPPYTSGSATTSLSPSSTSALASKKLRHLTSPSLTFSIAEASRVTAQEAERRAARERDWDMHQIGEDIGKLRKRLWGGWKEGEGGKLDLLCCPTSLRRKLARLSAASPSYTPPAILGVPRSPSSCSPSAANSSPAAPTSPYLSLLAPVVGRPPRPLLPSLNPSPLSSSSLARSHPRPPAPGSTSTSTHRRVSFALEYLYGRTGTDAEQAQLNKRDKAFSGFVRTMAGVAGVNESYSTLEREERGVAVEERSWEERG